MEPSRECEILEARGTNRLMIDAVEALMLEHSSDYIQMLSGGVR